MFVGLDGYRGGWVAVWIGERESRIEFIPAIDSILDKPFKRAMIDIPIGLPLDGYRGCDEAAREFLAPHQSRVFLGARRWILDSPSLAEANREARRLEQKGVSAQLYCLSRKIEEVDRLVRKAGQRRIRETHPELVFRRLHGKSLPSKKTPQGHTVRRAILENAGFRELDSWLQKRLGTGAKPDGVLDACACAIAAKDGRDRLPARDARSDDDGLRMEIHY